jgi:hypothetical protein
MDMMTRSMTKDQDQTATTKLGKKRIVPSPTLTVPVKKLFQRNCPLEMCLNCKARMQRRECECHLSFQYAPSEGSKMLKLALAAEAKHLEELKRLQEEREALEKEIEIATRDWSTDSD